MRLSSRVLNAVLALLVLLTGACGQSSGFRDPYTAVVGPVRARFTFPLPERDTWSWDQPVTEARSQEYQWEVEVTNAGETFVFGYSHFKQPNPRPQEGDLWSLIGHGQASVWRKTSEGSSLFTEASVQVRPEGADRLVVWIDDSWTRAQLFGENPDSVTFLWKLLGEAPQSVRVPVTYVDELGYR